MIYIKIYLDKDENGDDMLVFDSAKHDDEKAFFTVAGEKEPFLFYDEPIPHFENSTKVIGVEQVAISPEAKELFTEMLNDESTHKKMPYGHSSDFAMLGCYNTEYGWDSGKFAYHPQEIQNGDTRKTLRRTDRFTVEYVFSQEPLDYMMPCLNEMLKSLDLTAPADEKPLLDAYYSEMRARGEELGCDVDTIHKTPLRYLTEEQKEVIRAEYRRMVAAYDSQEWNESRDYDHAAMLEAKIGEAIIKKYGKIIRD